MTNVLTPFHSFTPLTPKTSKEQKGKTNVLTPFHSLTP